MTQTASFKDKLKNGVSIFKWELKNCSGALIVFAILASVFTAITLTLSLAFGFTAAGSGKEFDYSCVLAAVAVFQVVATYIVFYTNAIFTIVYTIRIYSYLHNKRKADMYGSMPVSRRTFYVAKTVSAFIFSVVPTLFFFGIIAIISVCFGQMVIIETAKVYVQLLVGSIACISFYGLLSVCCGTTLNSVLSFIAINFAYPVSALFIKGTIKSFFFGLPTSNYNSSFIMKALNPLAAYDGVNVIYWILFTAACLFLGTFLVKKRKAEAAQTSFAYYLPCYIVKLLVAFIFGMFLGVLFGSLNIFNNGYAGFVFGFVLGSVPAYTISHLILYKGFSQLFKTAIPLGALVVAVVALMGFCNYDVFGYNSYVPSAETVKSAGLIDLDDCYLTGKISTYQLAKEASDDFTDSENIDTILRFHKQTTSFANRKSSSKFASVWISMFTSNIPSDLFNEGYCVAYRLENGRTVIRLYDNLESYNMFMDYSDYKYYNDTLAGNITNSEEYFKNYSPIMHLKASDITNFNVDILDISYGYSDFYINSNDKVGDKKANEDREKLLAAFRKDVAEKGRVSTSGTEICTFYINYYGDSIQSDSSFLSLLLSDLSYQRESYEVYSDYTNTIAALKEIGVLNSDNTINKNSPYN